MYGTTARGRHSAQQIPVNVNARKQLLEFYRTRDREDAERCASGQQKGRVSVYAAGVTRLSGDAEVYESYRIIRSAGIEIPPKAEAMIGALPQDWRQVCRVDAQGRLWTASLREKKASW